MGHRDMATTQIYADYAPSAREVAFIAAALRTTAAEMQTEHACLISVEPQETPPW